MGQKDLAERDFENHDDVFADIVNGLLFDGDPVIAPEELESLLPRQSYWQEGMKHDMERDVVKSWSLGNVKIVNIGLENQTASDRWMPLRVVGYDGEKYHTQYR